jgi:hypothetical protein
MWRVPRRLRQVRYVRPMSKRRMAVLYLAAAIWGFVFAEMMFREAFG